MNKEQEEAITTFICGQIIALAHQLNIHVLEEFLESPRSGGDFRYKRDCEEIARFYRRVFKPDRS